MKNKIGTLVATFNNLRQDAYKLQQYIISLKQNLTYEFESVIKEIQLSNKIRQNQQHIILNDHKQHLLQAQHEVQRLRKQVISSQDKYQNQIRQLIRLLHQKDTVIGHLSNQLKTACYKKNETILLSNPNCQQRSVCEESVNQLQNDLQDNQKNQRIQSQQSEVMIETQILKDCLNQICNQRQIKQECKLQAPTNDLQASNKNQFQQGQQSQIQLLNYFRDRLSTINQVTECDVDDMQFISPCKDQRNNSNEKEESKIYELNRIDSSIMQLTLSIHKIPSYFRYSQSNHRMSIFSSQSCTYVSMHSIQVAINSQNYLYEGQLTQINSKLIPSGFGTISKMIYPKNQGVPSKFYKSRPTKKVYYKGQWHNGYFHGWGKLFLANDAIYHGKLANGNLHGPGTIYFLDQQIRQFSEASRNKFVGNFQENEIKGQGLFQLQDGRSFSGTWMKNSLKLLIN